MLCWEAPGEFCHRRLVAEWLEGELGIQVPEWKLEQPDVPVIPLSFYPPKAGAAPLPTKQLSLMLA
jgi:hypothetical protein